MQHSHLISHLRSPLVSAPPLPFCDLYKEVDPKKKYGKTTAETNSNTRGFMDGKLLPFSGQCYLAIKAAVDSPSGITHLA